MLLFKLSPFYPPHHHHPSPLGHFVHMVLFFHCADDDEPVLQQREEESGCVWKPALWWCGEKVTLSPPPVPRPISGTNNFHLSFLTDVTKKEDFEDTSTHRDEMTRTLIQPHQLNGLFSRQGQNTRRRCYPKLHKTYFSERERERKKDKKLDIIHGTSSLVALYVFVRRHTHTHTLSRAGLHPRPLRHNVDRTEEITERQSASAHSVRRVYMTMSKWGDV